MRRHPTTASAVLAVLGVAVLGLVPAGSGRAQDDAPDDPASGGPPVSAPADEDPAPDPGLVPIPSGCSAPEPPDIVFVGELVDADFRTGRFEIDQVRAGDATPFAADGLIDVRYGIDVRYLEVGRVYLVSARRDPVLGVLASAIRAPAPDFAGDDVISVTESDVECPVLDDPVRTLHPDGSAVESGVFAPLFEARTRLLGSVAIPLAVAFGVVFLLTMLKLSVVGVATGVGRVARRRR